MSNAAEERGNHAKGDPAKGQTPSRLDAATLARLGLVSASELASPEGGAASLPWNDTIKQDERAARRAGRGKREPGVKRPAKAAAPSGARSQAPRKATAPEETVDLSWADIGAPPDWAVAGDTPAEVEELLQRWDGPDAAAPTGVVGDSEAGEDAGEPGVGASSRGARRTQASEDGTQPDRTALEREEHARALALRLLTAAPRTRYELLGKLLDRDVDPEAAETVLDRFEEVRLLDDAAFARAWVASRSRSKGYAAGRLRRELQGKGVAIEWIDAALEQLDPEDQEERAVDLAAKRLGHRPLPPPGGGAEDRAERDKVLRRLVGFLARKGFAPGLAMKAARTAMERHGQEQ